MDEELNAWYLSLPDADKQIFLAGMSSDLTLHGRAFGKYETGEKQIRAFLGLNELQHLISQHIGRIGRKSDRYREEVFLQILAEEAQKFGLAKHLKQSLESARSTYFPKKTPKC